MRLASTLLSVALLGGCVVALDEESIGDSRYGDVVHDCVVPLPPELEAWGPPVGLEYGDRSVWLWNDVTLTGGAAAHQVAAEVFSAPDVCASGPALITDATGLPVTLLRLTPGEEANNAARTDGRHVRLDATGGFVHEGRGHLYYEKILAGPGFFDAERLGTGLCIMEQPGDPCVRATPNRYADEPTLLWDASERPWNRGAFVDADGYAYVWGCHHAAAFEDLCSVARVLPAEAADPSAYRYRNDFDFWIEDPWNTTTLLDNVGAITPTYSAYLGDHLLFTMNFWEGTLDVWRSGGNAWTWLTDPVVLFTPVSPDDWFVAGGVEHAGLRAADGRTFAFSYYSSVDGSEHGLHLVTFRWVEKE